MMFERLTYRDELGTAVYKWDSPTGTKFIANKAIKRLAAYEDSGLSPEQVQRLVKKNKKNAGSLEVGKCRNVRNVNILRKTTSRERL